MNQSLTEAANKFVDDANVIFNPEKFSEEIVRLVEKYGKNSKSQISIVLLKYYTECKKAEQMALENLRATLTKQA